MLCAPIYWPWQRFSASHDELRGRGYERQEDARKLESHDPLALPIAYEIQEAPKETESLLRDYELPGKT